VTNPATTADLESRWRPLTTQQTVNGQTFLDDAWGILRRRIPTLEAAMADPDTGADLTAEVVRIMATAVLRVMKNPDGKRQESIDDYSWTRDQAVSAGLLYFSDLELDDLVPGSTVRGRAYSVDGLGDYAARLAE
jgi:hypothetical protein